MSQDMIELATNTFNQLPETVKAGAFQAINRLIGSAASVPEAYLRRWSQRVNSKTDSEADVWKKLSGHVGDRVAADEAMMDRATTTLLGDAFRKQDNREAIAIETVRLLNSSTNENPDIAHPAASPNDDWMNVFVEYAEKASSEGLRNLWAKVLSGEIRSPGEFSLSTIRFISELDKNIAELFEEVSSDFFSDFVFNDQSDRTRDITKYLTLEEAGLLNGASGTLSKVMLIPPEGIVRWGSVTAENGGCMLVAKGPPGKVTHVPAMILTRTGREIIKLLPKADPYKGVRAVAEYLGTQGFERVEIVRISRMMTGQLGQLAEVIYPKPSPPSPS